MATYIITHGHARRVREPDVGPPLVLTGAEWRQRSETLFTSTVRRVILLILLLTWVIVPSTLLLGDPGLTRTALVLGVMFTLTVMALLGNMLWFLTRGIPVGLYERGVQHPTGYFIPYAELTGLSVKDDGKDGYSVHLELREWPNRGRGPFCLPFDLLGEEGMRELETRVTGDRNGTGGM